MPTLQVVHGDGTLSGGNQTLETPSPKQARDTLVVSSVPEKASGQQLVVWSRDGKHIEARYFRPLDAGFRAAPATGPAPLTVVFTDTTSPLDKADRWAWDFGDGHLIVAQQHPQHSYSAPGVYSVTLTVSDSRSGESESLLLPAAITVTEATIQERTITYTYDSLSRLTAATYSTGETYSYQYDPVGNRVAYTLTTPLDGTAVTTYTYDAANRLLVSASPGHSVTYTWDDRGNLLSDGMFTYTYNAAGRMVRAESVTATLVYTYNADGLRVAQAQSVATVESVDLFTWDWAAGVPELLSDGDSLYLIGYDTLGWQRGDDWTFVLPDALGSVRQETDGAGAVIAVREWTPYGEEIGGTQAGLGFTGEWFDTGVGLQYLRARWLDVGTGRFTSMDPWAGDRRQSLTLNPYLYVVANPLNAVDPSGWYHKDVHLELTKRLVLELGSGWPDAEKLAETIAEANQHVDDFGSILNSLFCRECHFCDKTRTDIHINEAINRSNPYLFGAALHQFQDFYSHWNEGFERSHGWETVRAGVNLSGSPRSPGGKSHRLELLLEDFFLGGHFENYGEIPLWIESPYPAHPRDEVIAEIQSRNPVINLDGLNDDDLIDLYLRRDWGSGDWAQREREQSYFGLDPDAYIESSLRDTRMRQTSRVKIAQFLLRALNPCAIDWSKPSDDEIKMLLTK